MNTRLDSLALDQLFRSARTRNDWTDRPVTEDQLRELYELLKFGPTSANCCPARFVWVVSDEAKARLAALAAPGNAEKILSTPVTVIIGHDLDFAEKMPTLFRPRGEQNATVFLSASGGGSHRLSKRQPPGSLPDPRGACTAAGLWSDVGIQQ